MDSELRLRFEEMTDSSLVEQYTRLRHEYTGEAVAMMKEELARRAIDVGALEKREEEAARARPQYRREDFEPFELSFSQYDIVLAQLILRDNGIPFFVELPPPVSSMLPIEAQSTQYYTLHVLRDRTEQARALIGDHFSGSGGKYTRKTGSVKDRIRSLSFSEIGVDEKDMDQFVDVAFGAAEKQLCARYVRRLIDEADEVEKRIERGIFYYDNLEILLGKITGDGGEKLTNADLLTILETLQIYCDEENFPSSLEQAGEAILEHFFSMNG
jgi:hypothetical protein